MREPEAPNQQDTRMTLTNDAFNSELHIQDLFNEQYPNPTPTYINNVDILIATLYNLCWSEANSELLMQCKQLRDKYIERREVIKQKFAPHILILPKYKKV